MNPISCIILSLLVCTLCNCAYDKSESIANAYYAAITHCPGK
jgi:hypothetical protein